MRSSEGSRRSLLEAHTAKLGKVILAFDQEDPLAGRRVHAERISLS
jgi:hypothetical protein